MDLTLRWRLMLGIGVVLPVGLLVLTLVYMKEPKKVEQSEIVENIHLNFDSEIGTSSSKKTLVMGFLMETVLAFILQFTGNFFLS